MRNLTDKQVIGAVVIALVVFFFVVFGIRWYRNASVEPDPVPVEQVDQVPPPP